MFLAEEWKIHRRLITPAISSSSSSAHLPLINQHIRDGVTKLPADGEFFDILQPFIMCTMNIFLEASLGSDWEDHTKQTYLKYLAE